MTCAICNVPLEAEPIDVVAATDEMTELAYVILQLNTSISIAYCEFCAIRFSNLN